jgi:4-amino-4-deoxy-L-arabinose transferase-like glycosyltransferase
VSMSLHSIPDGLRVFTTPRPDGFYRPLTYLSLWADYRVFGSALWGYHLQSILLHALNSVLVYGLACELRFERNCAFWAASWFALAAMGFEPVLWPAARFDLLATALVLVSIIFFLRYLRDPDPAGGRGQLLLSAAAYGLALMNKESGYCVPLLLIAIVLTGKTWQLDSLDRSKLKRAALVFCSITALMLAVRIAIYHGLGGYPATIYGGASPHFTFTFKSITGLVTRVIPIPLLGLNLSVPFGPAMTCCVILYVVVIAWVVVKGASLGKAERALVGLALLSALPTLNLVGWVGESMRHSRYLYLPGLWIVMAAAILIARRPFGNIALTLVVAANLAGAIHNLGVYRTMLDRAHAISQEIADDSAQYHANIVDLASIDDGPFGVLFFRSEIDTRLRAAQPGVCISLIPDSCEPGRPALLYDWLPAAAAVRVHYLPEGLPRR